MYQPLRIILNLIAARSEKLDEKLLTAYNILVLVILRAIKRIDNQRSEERCVKCVSRILFNITHTFILFYYIIYIFLILSSYTVIQGDFGQFLCDKLKGIDLVKLNNLCLK